MHHNHEKTPSTLKDKSDLPGSAIQGWNLFREHVVDDKVEGFTAPDGKYFPLADDESVVHIREGDQRQTFIQTPEGRIPFEEWGPRVVADNMERLGDAGEVGEYLMPFYAAALAADPRLQNVLVNPSGSKEKKVLGKTGGFAVHQGKTESGRYEITFNTEDGWGHFEDLLSARRASVKVSAEKAGLDGEKMDAKTLAAFIFLHELGHIVDYMDNAPTLEESTARRKKDMDSLPWAGWNPASLANYLNSDEGKLYWSQNAEEWRRAGYADAGEFLRRQEQQYHALETEDNPDQFAARVLRELRESQDILLAA